MSEIGRVRLPGLIAEPMSHYTDAVHAAGLLFVSGMLPVDPDGALVGEGDVVRQAEQSLENIKTVLEAVGASFADVVKIGLFVRRMADRRAINEVRQRYFGAARPASTLVEVSALAHPSALLEIEAVALLPAERDPVQAQ